MEEFSEELRIPGIKSGENPGGIDGEIPTGGITTGILLGMPLDMLSEIL